MASKEGRPGDPLSLAIGEYRGAWVLRRWVQNVDSIEALLKLKEISSII